MSDKTFLFQLNVTRDCNLRCTHCYISTDKKAASQFVTEEQFIESFQQIVDFMKKDYEGAKQYGLAEIHVIGGEPTMLGLKFYNNTIPIIRELLSQIPQKYSFTIVTNLVTGNSIKIAKLFDNIATSYEHETRFLSKTGVPKPELEKKWERNIAQLQSEGIQPTVTTAVTKNTVERGAEFILEHFYELGFKQIHLGFFIPSGDGLTNIVDVFPSFESTTKFMIEATDWYLKRRLIDKELYINPIESMIESIYEEKPMDDIVCPIIPGSLDVDWNGDTVTCLEAGGEVDMTSLGNIFETSIVEIVSSAQYRRERTNAIVAKPACLGCDEFLSCQSACGVLHQYWNGRGECPGFKGFIKYIRGLVENKGVRPKKVELKIEKINKMNGC